MKKWKWLSFFVACFMLILLLPTQIFAATHSGNCGDNLTWSLTTENGVLTISGTGDMDCGIIWRGKAPWTSYYPTIRSVVIEEGVTSIEAQAFKGCNNIENVTLPESLTSIGMQAFYNCNLKQITIPANVTTIGQNAFYNCDNLKTAGPIGGGYDYEFGWTTSIPNHAFHGCYGLQEITLPSTLKSIGNLAFQDCQALKSVIIPEGVTSIGQYAFAYGGLQKITVPASVTNIGKNAFYGCDVQNAGPIGGGYDYEFAWTDSIPNYAFHGCKSLIDVILPSQITTIGDFAFYDCKSLTNIVLPSAITQIGADAFHNCETLTSIELPNGISKIDEATFIGCKNLTSIEIPNSVTNIGEFAFDDCTSLTDVHYKGTEEEWNAISIASYNEPLINATFHFNPPETDDETKVTEIFTDVFENDWFVEAVQFVYDNGMMSGNAGSFTPNENMTRAMMVTTLYRLSGSPNVTDYKATSLFSDVEAGSWYEDAVNWAYNTNVTTGYTDSNGNSTHFGSNDKVTREQLAVFLHRYAKTQGYDVSVRADITNYVGYSEISDYASEAMEWAVGVGLISGLQSEENGIEIYDLAPKGNATRAQLATILMRFCKYYQI